MKRIPKEGYYYEYPKRPFLIYSVKYNDLFWLLPICFVMFFIKGGGWVYSIIVLALWFIIAVHWSKTLWIQECQAKGQYKLYYNGEWINQHKPTDFHDDPRNHKHDELHFVYNNKENRWKSREEVELEYEEWAKEAPYMKDTIKRGFEQLEAGWKENIKNGL